MNPIGSCGHGRDPRQCPICAPELVERFKAIAEAFAIVRAIGFCAHPTTYTYSGMTLCKACGARRVPPGVWKLSDLAGRAHALASRADLSNPFKNTA